MSTEQQETAADCTGSAQGPWVCPWGICNQEQAQECRGDTRKGCGGVFPRGTTLEQAKQFSAPRAGTCSHGCPHTDVCKAIKGNVRGLECLWVAHS